MGFPPQMVPPGTEPAAPPGAIVVMGAESGFAVPARRFTLLFGRERDDVHVPIGVNDSAVSRKHGVFTCTGENGEWWLRNTGRLPIELPGGALMLTGHERRMEPGHTPLVISSSAYSSYLLDVHVVGYEGPQLAGTTGATTEDPQLVYELSPPERLAITALAARYLQGHDRNPLPLSWTADGADRESVAAFNQVLDQQDGRAHGRRGAAAPPRQVRRACADQRGGRRSSRDHAYPEPDHGAAALHHPDSAGSHPVGGPGLARPRYGGAEMLTRP